MHHSSLILLLDMTGCLNFICLQLWEVAGLIVTVELPNEDAVLISSRNYLIVVAWVKHHISDRVCVPDKRLEVIWHCLLCFVVPHLDHVIITA